MALIFPGLNIVDFMLHINGFEAYHFEVAVSAEKLVEKLKVTGAKTLEAHVKRNTYETT